VSIYKILLLFHTVRFLKAKQIYFRFYYLLRTKLRQFMNGKYNMNISSYAHTHSLTLAPSISAKRLYKNKKFKFLNLEYTFIKDIDWNYQEHGKLWTYNLNYFDYLLQEDLPKEMGLELINNFIEQSASIKDGFMPFPISLRGMNWIKFLSKYKIKDQNISDSLYAQYMILMDNIEYHILGNHLLENGFSLLFGAYYFEDDILYIEAKKILSSELKEQVLNDGAHFELSPMYHQIMLFRVLDCINLIRNNDWKEKDLLTFLMSKAEIMLGWLNTITYENGDIPLLNDSANYIAPTSKELNMYASILNLKPKQLALYNSGYRKIQTEYYEMIVDIGNIGPDYIPGHAHSDTFNFEIYCDNEPFIVDTGLSTYESTVRRTLERSSVSHNTVVVDGINQSEVWGGFRVARRAKIIHLEENKNYIEATHDGYKRIGVQHTRRFISYKDSIVIEDELKSSSIHEGIAYLHFYPNILPKVKGNKIIIKQKEITIHSAKSITLEPYEYAPEFNKRLPAYKVKIVFTEYLKMEIKL